MMQQKRFFAQLCLGLLIGSTILPLAQAANNPPLTQQSPYYYLAKMHLPSLANQQLEEQVAFEMQSSKLEKLAKEGKLSATAIPVVQEVEKLNLLYDIFSTHHAESQLAPAQWLDPNVITDLSLFCGSTERPEDHLSSRIPTMTAMGKIEAQRLLLEPLATLPELKNRQAIIRELVSNTELFDKIQAQLTKIKDCESDFIWFWKAMAPETARFLDQVYIQADGQNATSVFNKNQLTMQLFHSIKTHILPSIGITLPLSVGVGMLVYANIVIIASMLLDYTPRVDSERALREINYDLAPQMPYYAVAYPYALLYEAIHANGFNFNNPDVVGCSMLAAAHAGIWAYFIYAFVGHGIQQNNLANKIHGHLQPVGSYAQSIASILRAIVPNECLRTLMPATKALVQFDRTANTEAKALIENLKTSTFQDAPSFFSNRGRVLSSFKMMLACKNHFVESMKAIGQLDALMAIARLYKTHANNTNGRYCFVDYEETSAPHIKATKLWMPMLNPATVVTNDLELGGDSVRNILLTGVNAGGKSTIIKALLEAEIMALTLTIAPATAFTTSKFRILRSYMNLADATGSASLYQAEMRRIKGLLEALRSLPEGECALIAMDEIFTGTNYNDAVIGAKLVIDEIAGFKNCVCLFATHYLSLTAAAAEHPGVVGNAKVSIIKNADGTMTFPYKIEPGISDQSIGLELLVQEGVFGNNILNNR